MKDVVNVRQSFSQHRHGSIIGDRRRFFIGQEAHAACGVCWIHEKSYRGEDAWESFLEEEHDDGGGIGLDGDG